MSILEIETARAFAPLLAPRRYKGAHGGRGSGKSHFFAEMLVEDAFRRRDLRAVCIREVQKSLKESAKKLIEDKIQALGLGPHFDVQAAQINTPGGGVILFQGMQDHTAESIKSLEGMDVAWVEEAQTLSDRSWRMLRPTIRKPGSEIWASWNPRLRTDPVDKFFRQASDADVACVQANWRDNPWFPAVLEAERQRDLKNDPDGYGHVWEGEYVTVMAGAYYAKALREAKEQGRIGKVAADPLLQVRTFHDIGGTGAKSDLYSIVAAQFVDREIRVLDHYSAQGQPIAEHVAWMRQRGYARAKVVLPHDGANPDLIVGKRYADHWREAGFDVDEPYRGVGGGIAGAASQRVEGVRRLFPRIWFNEATTEALRASLGWYHARIDEDRGIDLGPDHDWSCFTGDTEILTRYGTRPIMDLPETGEVLTPCGWKRYVRPRMTRRAAPLVEVVFADGLTVRCTPDHLFLTDSGWKSASSLRKGSLIQSSLTRQHSISMAVFTECGRVSAILAAAAVDFIGMFGSPLSDQFRRAATFIIETRTSSIIGSKIWNAFQPASTFALSAPTPRGECQAPMRSSKPLRGMPQKRAGNGIAVMLSALSRGPSGNESSAVAHSAAKSLRPLFGVAEMRKFIAVHLARWLRIVRAESKTNGRLRIESVTPLSEVSDVWCLTVPGEECFSLANGAVVHNCHDADAFGLMCVAYEEPRKHAAKLAMPQIGVV